MPANGEKTQAETTVNACARIYAIGKLLGYRIEVDNGVIIRQEPIPSLMFWSPVST